MDTKTTVLVCLVALAVLGQLCLPILGRWNNKRQDRQARQRIARLVEDAADRQCVVFHNGAAKLGNDLIDDKLKGIGGE
jgi:hypothetical protein